MARQKTASVDPQAPVAVYKALLRRMVDRRPSGTRQKIATAIGKHRSFVSQITNPGYPGPVPAKHLRTIFELCHISAEERRAFMDAYERAHPGRSLPAADSRGEQTLVLSVPVLGNPRRQAELAKAIRRFAAQLAELALRWDVADHAAPAGADEQSEPQTNGESPR